MPRIPKKTTTALAYAEELGKLKAQLHMDKSKPWGLYLKELAQKFIEHIKLDPMEAIAVAGGTILVHETLFSIGNALAGSAVGNLLATNKYALDPIGLFNEVSKALGSIFASGGDASKVSQDIKKGPFGFLLPQSEEEAKQWSESHDVDRFSSADVYLWLISFSLAFVLVRHAGEILGSIPKLTGWLTGILAV